MTSSLVNPPVVLTETTLWFLNKNDLPCSTVVFNMVDFVVSVVRNAG
jgi:hypothetical protein